MQRAAGHVPPTLGAAEAAGMGEEGVVQAACGSGVWGVVSLTAERRANAAASPVRMAACSVHAQSAVGAEVGTGQGWPQHALQQQAPGRRGDVETGPQLHR